MATATIDGSISGLAINNDVRNSAEYQAIYEANEAKFGTSSSSGTRKTKRATEIQYKRQVLEGNIDPPSSAKGPNYKIQHNTPNGLVDATPKNNLTQAEADAALLNYDSNATTTTNPDGSVNIVPGDAQYAKTNDGTWVGTTTNAEGNLVPDTSNVITETPSNHDSNTNGPEIPPASDLTQAKINQAAEVAAKPRRKTDQELLDAKETLRSYEKYTKDKQDAVLAENGPPDSYAPDFDGEDNLNKPQWNDADKQAKFDQAQDQYFDARQVSDHLSGSREYKNARTNQLAAQMGVANTSVSADGKKVTSSTKSTRVGGVPVVINGVGVPANLLYDDELQDVNASRQLGASMKGQPYDEWQRGEINPYRDENNSNAVKTNTTAGNNKVVLVPDSDASSTVDADSEFPEQNALNDNPDQIVGDTLLERLEAEDKTKLKEQESITDTDKLDQTNTDASKAAIYVMPDGGPTAGTTPIPRLLTPEEVQQYRRDGRLPKIDRGLLDAIVNKHSDKVQDQLLAEVNGEWPDKHHADNENKGKDLDINLANSPTFTSKEDNKFDPFRTPSTQPGVGKGNKISLTIPPSNTDFKFQGHLGILNAEGNRGVAFPYTPTIQITHGANYGTHEITHSVYQPNYFINNPNSTINITAQFTSQSVKEAQYTKAALHFFKAITRMDYGEATRGTTAGTPPPVCFFNGYGSHMFSKNLPVILSSLNYTLLEDTDYVTVDGETVPTQILVSLDLRIQLVPTKVRKEFDINKYRSGELLKNPGGFF